MTQPLTDQRPRADLVTELYDRHAAGLFAYCADQLGDHGSAADTLMTVLSGVPATALPRAALYAFARREIHRRDVVYAPPVVDPLIDPASALVERTLRELRPHQREVLLLCEVCGLGRAELAWVLDVAPDTAEELATSAAHRYRQLLGRALAATGARVPKPVADVYGALGVAPLRDVLGRLPWPLPPASLRVHFAGSRTAGAAPLFVKPLWPVPPRWPLPLSEPDPATSTAIFPAELLAPPPPARVPEHDATTAPMPRLRDPMAPTDTSGFGRVFSRPRERPFFLSAPVPDVVRPEPPATGDVLVHRTPVTPPSPGEGSPGNLFVPQKPAEEPVYRMPLPEEFARPPGSPPSARQTGARDTGAPKRSDSTAPAAVRASDAPERADRKTDRQPAARKAGGRESDTWQADTRKARGRETDDRETTTRKARGRETDTWQTTTRKAGGRETDAWRARGREIGSLRPGRGGAGPVPGDRESGARTPPAAGRADRKTGGRAFGAPHRPGRARPVPGDRRVAGTVPGDRRPVKAAAGRGKVTPKPGARKPGKPGKPQARKRRRGNHDWAWELIGFLICVAIAMIVFFSMPSLIGP
ncbi:hypothetical protein [Nonomuraea sp. NPDC048916]|uniref:hypothetical protein n=1 Tax=Nonomuraea sp. NPDC048916 TaxID=3154232 RepID=UPI0033EBAFDA